MENNKVMKIAALGFIGAVIGPTVIRTGFKLMGHAANKLMKNRTHETEQADVEVIEVVAEETL